MRGMPEDRRLECGLRLIRMQRKTESGGNSSARVAAGFRRAGVAVAAGGLVVTGLMAGATGASATPAAKAAGAAVSVGNIPVGSYIATSMSVSFSLNGGTGATCTSTAGQPYAVQAMGPIPPGSMPSAGTIPDAITSVLFNSDGGCEALGLPVTVTADPPYSLTIVNVPGEDADGNPASADGYIPIPSTNPISVVIGTAGDPANSCSFTVDGDVPGWYDAAPPSSPPGYTGTDAEVSLAPDIPDDVAPTPLTIENVTGDLCVAGVNNGDIGIFKTNDPFHVTTS